LLMFGDISGISCFVLFRPTPGLVAGFLLLLAYAFGIFLLNVRIKIKRGVSYASALCVTAVFFSFIAVKPVYSAVYSAFEINIEDDNNIILTNERFTESNLIAYFTESISKEFDKILIPPESYSPESIGSILGNPGKYKGISKNTEEKNNGSFKPNIVIIMSESFADMRLIDGISVPGGVYDGFDYVAEKGHKAISLVPTFGGGTVKSEFELLFGLPMKSIKNVSQPQNIFLTDEASVETFARLYSDSGYSSTYLHPFQADFYNRDKVYAEFGFDRLIFEDDLTVEPSYFYEYVDDKTVFGQIEKLLGENGGASYIFATTMQNHMPYINGEFEGGELEFYFSGVKKTCGALKEFYDYVMSLDYPTAVMFIGDHYPGFSPESDVYNGAGLTADNCYEIYVQPYLMFDNFGADYGIVPETCVSAFYLPHLLNAATGAETSEFSALMLEKMPQTPIYTDVGLFVPQDEELDLLTYDRTIGEGYSLR